MATSSSPHTRLTDSLPTTSLAEANTISPTITAVDLGCKRVGSVVILVLSDQVCTVLGLRGYSQVPNLDTMINGYKLFGTTEQSSRRAILAISSGVYPACPDGVPIPLDTFSIFTR